MALPALEKTWEFVTNQAAAGSSNYNLHRDMIFKIKQALTDTAANGYQDGTIANVGGDTFSISGITDDTVDVSMVTKTVKIRGSTNPLNDGDFPIVAVPTSTEFHYTNANGVPEAVNGSWNILAGNFTSPWICQHSQIGGSVTGVRDDEIDRWGRSTDVILNTTNYSYFVFKNPVTLTEWAWIGELQFGSGQEDARVRTTTYPNYFDEGNGSSESRPESNTVTNLTGSRSAHRQWFSDQSWFWGAQIGVAKFHVMMSDDGQNTRVLGTGNGYNQFFWFDETVKNPHPDWISSGYAVVTSMVAGTAGNSNRVTYGVYNDAANVIGSVLPATYASNALDHHSPDLYLSAEGYGSAMVGQNLTVANELTGEWGLFPIGIICTEYGHRGRIGQLVDMWWNSTGLNAMQTFPANTSRQFLCLADITIPWDGTLPEWS